MVLKKSSELLIGGKILEAGNSQQFKTGGWKSKKPVLDRSKCISCMRCVDFCPDMAIKSKEVLDDKGIKKMMIESIDLDHCKGCGICANECPVKAIVMESLDAQN